MPLIELPSQDQHIMFTENTDQEHREQVIDNMTGSTAKTWYGHAVNMADDRSDNEEYSEVPLLIVKALLTLYEDSEGVEVDDSNYSSLSLSSMSISQLSVEYAMVKNKVLISNLIKFVHKFDNYDGKIILAIRKGWAWRSESGETIDKSDYISDYGQAISDITIGINAFMFINTFMNIDIANPVWLGLCQNRLSPTDKWTYSRASDLVSACKTGSMQWLLKVLYSGHNGRVWHGNLEGTASSSHDTTAQSTIERILHKYIDKKNIVMVNDDFFNFRSGAIFDSAVGSFNFDRDIAFYRISDGYVNNRTNLFMISPSVYCPVRHGVGNSERLIVDHVSDESYARVETFGDGYRQKYLITVARFNVALLCDNSIQSIVDTLRDELDYQMTNPDETREQAVSRQVCSFYNGNISLTDNAKKYNGVFSKAYRVFMVKQADYTNEIARVQRDIDFHHGTLEGLMARVKELHILSSDCAKNEMKTSLRNSMARSLNECKRNGVFKVWSSRDSGEFSMTPLVFEANSNGERKFYMTGLWAISISLRNRSYATNFVSGSTLMTNASNCEDISNEILTAMSKLEFGRVISIIKASVWAFANRKVSEPVSLAGYIKDGSITEIAEDVYNQLM